MSDPKKKLYLVRHGQTLFNERGLRQGWCDSPLTPLGRLQAAATAGWLDQNGIRPESWYCSTLGRTEQTLQQITGAPYVRLEGLREFHYGSMEGTPISSSDPGGNGSEDFYQKLGGESRAQVEKRMRETLTSIVRNDPAKTIFVCTHGASAFCFARSVDPEKAAALRKFENCAIYEFEYENGRFFLKDIINEHVRSLKKPL